MLKLFYCRSVLAFAVLLGALTLLSCDRNGDNHTHQPEIPDRAKNFGGFGIYEQILGVWNGPLTSGTDLGNAEEWAVDFRPIAGGHVLGSSELDSKNDIFMAFLGAQYGADSIVVFRNGGHWDGRERISYCRIDSVSETAQSSFYRFVDFVKGAANIRADFLFRNDSLYAEVHTFRGFHFRWQAKRVNNQAWQQARQHWNYPQPEIRWDLTEAFGGRTISTFYNGDPDPYAESKLPYVGSISCTVEGESSHPLTSVESVFFVLTPQPAFQNNIPNLDSLRARSRYVILRPSQEQTFVFPYAHPGTYYVNCFADRNSNGLIDSGDYMAFPPDMVATLESDGQVGVVRTLNLTIP